VPLTLAASLVAVLTAAPAGFRNGVGMEFARIPAGSFWMGSPAREPGRLPNEGPLREVRITRPFLMGVHEVTVGQFRAFVEATGYRTEAERDAAGGFGIDFETGEVVQDPGVTWRAPGFPGLDQTDEHPVVLVSWQDAEAFCRWLSESEGRRYRLPTEAEWEYAARGGRSEAWWTGSEPERLATAANLADAALRRAMPAVAQSETWDDGYAFTAPVGRFAPNPFGLHDVHGNVWEWCLDWYGDYDAGETLDPRGPVAGRFRTIRGGGWLNPALQNRSAQRVYFAPTFRYCLLSGFRVLLEID